MLKERFLVDVKVDRTVECGDHAGCQTLRKGNWEKIKIPVLDFKRADFCLFRDLLGTVLQDRGLGREGDQEGCFIVKSLLVQVQ